MIAAACARRSLSDTPDGFENLSINAFFSASAAEKVCARQRKLSLLHLARFAPGPPSPLARFPACQQFLSQSLSNLLSIFLVVCRRGRPIDTFVKRSGTTVPSG